MKNTFDLGGKVVAVTGGYGHLGKSIVEGLIEQGAKVVVLGKDETKFLKQLANSAFIEFQYCDVSDSSSIAIAFESIVLENGKIDAIINNAVYSRGNSPEEMTDDDWSFGIDGTLSSVFRCIREIIPHFKRQNFGKIVNVSSMYGMVSPDFSIYEGFENFLNPPHYGAAKAGILQLTRYYATYLGKYGVTVNSVTPGPFPSDKVQKNKEFVQKLKMKTVLNRIGRPEDLIGAFVFLISDSSNFVTGQNIVVDGGWTIT